MKRQPNNIYFLLINENILLYLSLEKYFNFMLKKNITFSNNNK